MGTTGRFTARLASRESNVTPGPMPEAWLDTVLAHFDQGTQRAILRLYRSSPPRSSSGRTRTSARLHVPALVAWGMQDPYIPARFAARVRGGAARSRAARAARRGPLAVVRPPGPARPARGVPVRAVIARLRRAPAWTLTAGLGLIYVILAPASPDLAAASYRSDLFSDTGFSLWDNAWYGGHHLLAYSVLAPALGALLGPRLLAPPR